MVIYMKKYLFSIFVALTVGFFMGKIFLEQYHDYQGLKVTSNSGEVLYFIQYGEYDSLDEVEKNTLTLTNYIYTIIDNKYYVYIGVTSNKDNLIKLTNHFSSKGYVTYAKEFLITNETFLESLKNYDAILLETTDYTVIDSISSQVLTKYEELIN